jgi:hypothetical protein
MVGIYLVEVGCPTLLLCTSGLRRSEKFVGAELAILIGVKPIEALLLGGSPFFLFDNPILVGVEAHDPASVADGIGCRSPLFCRRCVVSCHGCRCCQQKHQDCENGFGHGRLPIGPVCRKRARACCGFRKFVSATGHPSFGSPSPRSLRQWTKACRYAGANRPHDEREQTAKRGGRSSPASPDFLPALLQRVVLVLAFVAFRLVVPVVVLRAAMAPSGLLLPPWLGRLGFGLGVGRNNG